LVLRPAVMGVGSGNSARCPVKNQAASFFEAKGHRAKPGSKWI
jgi:hypothetical protein